MKRKPFDYQQVCPQDLARPFPAVAGKGRGKPLAEAVEAARKLQGKDLTKPETAT